MQASFLTAWYRRVSALGFGFRVYIALDWARA